MACFINILSRVVRSYAPNCGVTYDCHSDDSEVSFTLLENIFSKGITHDECHL